VPGRVPRARPRRNSCLHSVKPHRLTVPRGARQKRSPLALSDLAADADTSHEHEIPRECLCFARCRAPASFCCPIAYQVFCSSFRLEPRPNSTRERASHGVVIPAPRTCIRADKPAKATHSTPFTNQGKALPGVAAPPSPASLQIRVVLAGLYASYFPVPTLRVRRGTQGSTAAPCRLAVLNVRKIQSRRWPPISRRVRSVPLRSVRTSRKPWL